MVKAFSIITYTWLESLYCRNEIFFFFFWKIFSGSLGSFVTRKVLKKENREDIKLEGKKAQT